MGNWTEMQSMCQYCRGTGIYPDGSDSPESCGYCKGVGYEDSGRVKVKGLEEKLDEILEILNRP